MALKALPKYLPLLLTATRALLAPAVVLLSLLDPAPLAFACCLVVAFASDIFDGILARRLGIATAGLRRFDSLADTLFYAACVFAAWHLYPDAIRVRARPLAVLIGLEVVRYLVDWLKFRREASYHMWSSKLWGIALFAAFFDLLVLGNSGWLLSFAIFVGIIADAEGMLISLVLPRWQSDVPSVWHAVRLRRAGAI